MDQKYIYIDLGVFFERIGVSVNIYKYIPWAFGTRNETKRPQNKYGKPTALFFDTRWAPAIYK